MIESVSIDFSLSNIWQSWYKFRRGKEHTAEYEIFSYYLEKNLAQLSRDLNNGSYTHGPYRYRIVTDNKRREIAVTSIRDRVVHRLVYEYLVPIFDPTFIYDAWSCRKNKGLIAAIECTQQFLHRYPSSYVWRSDIRKFFDSVDTDILRNLLHRKIIDPRARWLLSMIIDSYPSPIVAAAPTERERE